MSNNSVNDLTLSEFFQRLLWIETSRLDDGFEFSPLWSPCGRPLTTRRCKQAAWFSSNTIREEILVKSKSSVIYHLENWLSGDTLLMSRSLVQFHIQSTKLPEENAVWENPPVLFDLPDGLCEGEAVVDHQVGQDERGRPAHSDCAVNQNSSWRRRRCSERTQHFDDWLVSKLTARIYHRLRRARSWCSQQPGRNNRKDQRSANHLQGPRNNPQRARRSHDSPDSASSRELRSRHAWFPASTDCSDHWRLTCKGTTKS